MYVYLSKLIYKTIIINREDHQVEVLKLFQLQILKMFHLGVNNAYCTKYTFDLIYIILNNYALEICPPPDLPSLLLSNRIIYIGMPLVPSVTELVIAQLLYLNYQNDQTITLYINSPGTNSPDGKAYSFDTEAFAIADTMQFIKPPVRTICVGQSYGTAAMILSLGQKGNRFALPNASIMLNQPKSRARGQASDVAIKAKEIVNNRRVTNEFLAMVCSVSVCVI